MEADESDDHLCIRCKDTIFGIENYLNHRKICTIQKPPTPKPLEVSTPHHYSDNFNFPEAHDISFNYDDEVCKIMHNIKFYAKI